MSVTVTYKGQTLTTLDNQTKILETSGTWLEDDITITDVSSGGGGSDTATVDILFYQDEDGYIVIGDDYIPTAVGVSF